MNRECARSEKTRKAPKLSLWVNPQVPHKREVEAKAEPQTTWLRVGGMCQHTPNPQQSLGELLIPDGKENLCLNIN